MNLKFSLYFFWVRVTLNSISEDAIPSPWKTGGAAHTVLPAGRPLLARAELRSRSLLPRSSRSGEALKVTQVFLEKESDGGGLPHSGTRRGWGGCQGFRELPHPVIRTPSSPPSPWNEKVGTSSARTSEFENPDRRTLRIPWRIFSKQDNALLT